MASAIRQMTGVGGDVRKIARLLQKKAPPGHMLAYINQEEADLLKARGGSGKPHADTGVPSFEEELVPISGGLLPSNTYVAQGQDITTPSSTYATERGAYLPSYDFQESAYTPKASSTAAAAAPSGVEYGNIPPNMSRNEFAQQYALYGDRGTPATPAASVAETPVLGGDYASAPSGSRYIDQTLSDRYLPSAIGAPAPALAATTQDKDLLGKAQDYFATLSPETKKLLGQTAAAAIPGLVGAYQTREAAEQARKAKEEMMARSAPYKAQADEMITKARSGELTPVGQQQLQAVQAQAAQAAQGRGGVAAQQAMAQVEAYRQQLLQGQYDYGLKLANISDQIALGAIKTGLEADRYINAATMDYFNNAIRMFQGQSPQTTGQQPTDVTTRRT